MNPDFDVIVLGVGGMGSAALYSAAKRGLKVLGIEQFGAGHDRGSSHGQTRIIRAAYFEHPNYVPLARQSFSAWRAIEQESATDLLEVTGLLQVGRSDSEVIQGTRLSATTHGLGVRELLPSEIESRWPYFRIESEQVGLFEESAGYLKVEKCVAQLIRLARKRGAQMLSNSKVEGWTVKGRETVEVRLKDQSISANSLIVTAGPWAAEMLGDLGVALQVVRKQQHWFQTDRHEVHQGNGACCFLMDGPEGCFYGFPQIDLLGMKVAEHSGGQAVADPNDVDRQLNEQELARTTEFLARRIRLGKIRLVHSSVCLYTHSPDRHFIIDRYPGCPNVALAAGFSGHGFKFAPVIGEHLVDLIQGQHDPDYQFLTLQRFGARPTSSD